MMRARPRITRWSLRASATFARAPPLIPATGADSRLTPSFCIGHWSAARGRQERSEARPVGRSNVTKCAFHRCRCSVSTIVAPRPPSKKHCRCWSSIRTSFRRCSATESPLADRRQAGRSHPDHRACHRARSEQFIVASQRHGGVSRPGRCEGGTRGRRRNAAKRTCSGTARDARRRLAACGTLGIR
jgi:hypothetical protein